MPTVSDLFSLKYGHSLELNRLELLSDTVAVNFVGRAARNNGVTARVMRIQGLSPAKPGTISVALGGQGGAGVAFLQPYEYYCGRDVMILTPKRKMNEQEALWWATCITANRFRFGFGRQANRTLSSLELPSPTAIPEWALSADIDKYNGAGKVASSAGRQLSRSITWKAFTLDQLFEIRKGKRLTKAHMIPGTTPYIGASDTDNGITASVGQKPIHKGGTITVSYNGSVAEAFYQPHAFWATDDVNVLYPRGYKLAPAAALFVCTIIRREKYRFNYGRKWHLDRMRESKIRLPVTIQSNPDWEYMEQFINGLPYSSQIDALAGDS